MAVILPGYDNIETGLFCRIDVEQYRATKTGSYTQEILTFSDYYRTIEISGELYLPFGNLMNISSLQAELKASTSPVTITVSGIPKTSTAEIVNSKIKGSKVQVFRGLFDAVTGEVLPLAVNPVGRFTGFINNYSLEETFDSYSGTASNTISFFCESTISVLGNRSVGRQTNPESYKKLYPNDPSFDRVPNLQNNTFNFGGKA